MTPRMRAVVVGILLLAGAPAYAQDSCEIVRRVDQSTGAVTLSTTREFRGELLLAYEGSRGEGEVSMALAYQAPMIQLGLYYMGLERARLDGEGELIITIDREDGPRVQAIGAQASTRDEVTSEVVAFNLTEDDLRQIAAGERVRFRLPARRRLERELRPVHLECLRQFLAEIEK